MGAGVLFWLLIVLAVVTVVGHGIWLLLAKVFAALSAGSAPPPMHRRRTGRDACPRCLTALAVDSHRCEVCGWPDDEILRSHSPVALGDVRTQIERLARLGVLDAETRDRMVAALAAEMKRLQAATLILQAPSVEPPAAAPIIPPAEATAVDDVVLTPITEATAPTVPTEAAAPAAPPAPRPPAERVRSYAASRAAAAAEPPPPAPPPERPRREALSRLMATFMEEKNIRWGELVGGLLIVGCSVALVISFWAQIAQQPILKFVLLNGVTAALFGVGLYTDRKWKIHTTSHGILTIATLLVPLNFLAIAAFTQESPLTDLLSLAGEAASLVVFSLLTYVSARIIVPAAAGALSIGVMLPSLVQLLVRRWAGPAAAAPVLYMLAAAPAVSYVGCTMWPLRRHWTAPKSSGEASLNENSAAADDQLVTAESRSTSAAVLDQLFAQRLFTLLGTVSAAAFLPLALLAAKMPPVTAALHRLSPVVVMYGVPALLTGLLFWRRRHESLHRGTQTGGIAVGVLGAAMMAAAAALAWPEPAMLLPAAMMLVVVFTATAFACEIPAALVPAGLALAAAWLVGFQLHQGHIGWRQAEREIVTRAVLSIDSGHALAPLVGVFAACAGLLVRYKRRDDALMLVGTAGVTLVASLALLVWFGFGRAGDPGGATWTFAAYGVLALVAALVLDSGLLTGLAWALTLLAVVQGLVFRFAATAHIERPWIAALLTTSTLSVLVWAVSERMRCGAVNWLRATRWSVVPMSAAAAALMAVAMQSAPASTSAIYCAWLAIVWLAAAVLLLNPVVFTASQVVAVTAIFWAVVAALQGRAWYAAAAFSWLDPWFLETLGLALAGYCLAAAALREASSFRQIRATPVQEEVEDSEAPRLSSRITRCPPWMERVSEAAVVALVIVIGWYAAIPGAAQELMPLEAARGNARAVRVVAPIETFELAHVEHAHAAGQGAWLLTAAGVVVLAIGLWRHKQARLRYRAIVLVLAGVCPLVAVHWESDVAVASALRWFGAGFFLIASAAIWLRRKTADDSWTLTRREVRDLLVALVAFLYVAMGAYIVSAAVGRDSSALLATNLWPYLFGWAALGATAALAVPRATRFAAAAAPAIANRVTRRDAIVADRAALSGSGTAGDILRIRFGGDA